MNKDYIVKLWHCIEGKDLVKILRTMDSKGIKMSGFLKLEKVPSNLLINSFLKDESVLKTFLNSIKEYFIGENVDADSLDMNKDNAIGLISLSILNNDNNNINKYFDYIYSIKNDDEINKDDMILNNSVDGKIKYLGHIERLNTYYNFKPEFICENNCIVPIDEETRKNKFPEQGKINLSYLRQFNKSESQRFLTNDINADEFVMDDYSPNTALYFLNVDPYDIVENSDDRIRMKIDLQDLINKNINLKEVIYPIEQEGLYKVVTPKDEIITNDMFTGNIFVNEDNFATGTKVVLKYMNKLYGPYILYERAYDGYKYIMPNADQDNYIVKSYKVMLKNKLEFVKELRYDNIVTEVVKLPEEFQLEDKIIDSIILNKFKENIDLDLAKSNPKEFERQCTTSPFLNNVPDDIYKSRMEKIKKLFKGVKNFSEERKQIIKELLLNLRDGELDEILGNEIKKTAEYKNLLEDVQNSEVLQNELSKYKKENQELKENINSNISSNTENYDNIVKENEDLRKRCKAYEENLTIQENINNLNNENQRLDAINQDLVIKNSNLKKMASDMRKRVSDAIEDGVKDAGASKAFDPYLSNAMLKAAAMWQKEEEDNKYETAIKRFDDVVKNKQILDDDILIDVLVKKIQKYRNYSKNDILNILICLSQNFLTVFSGDPGTGKTSICNIISLCLGLDNLSGANDAVSINRYVPVSVERGWSSKRDLIGYYNPLTKQYDRSNSKIYDALMILNREGESSKYPYVVLLDEANLSPMEYYWADFMRATDRDSQDIYINIGLENDLYIPKTLRFLATINNDQTTEQLSPRLLDRTWVIKLPKVELKENVPCMNEPNDLIVSWSNLQHCFCESANTEIELNKVLNDIYDKFEKHNLSISPRIRKSIKDYICVAQNIMENEIGVCDNNEKALDFAIVQKLLPKIDGYWENYKRLFEELKQICVENHLQMTINALNDMEKFQEQNMGYCKYLV